MDRRRRMTSVKPGRGPSFVGGMTSLIAALVGFVWFLSARRIMGGIGGLLGPGQIFPLFGLLFTIFALANAVYNFRNATSENRHSLVDITDAYDEPDPLDPRLRRQRHNSAHVSNPHTTTDTSSGSTVKESSGGFCPYCGRGVDDQFSYCPGCGRRLP